MSLIGSSLKEQQVIEQRNKINSVKMKIMIYVFISVWSTWCVTIPIVLDIGNWWLVFLLRKDFCNLYSSIICFSWLWSGSIGHSVVDKKLSAFAQRLPRLSCGSFRTPHRASTYIVLLEPFDKACGSPWDSCKTTTIPAHCTQLLSSISRCILL